MILNIVYNYVFQSFAGPFFDAYWQCPTEIAHLFWYGIGQKVMEYYYSCLTNIEQSILSARFEAFSFPRGQRPFKFNFLVTIASHHRMGHFRRAWPIVLALGKDLGEHSKYALMVQCFSFFVSVFQIDEVLKSNANAILELQTQAKDLITVIASTTINVCANLHSLEELVYRDIPTWYSFLKFVAYI